MRLSKKWLLLIGILPLLLSVLACYETSVPEVTPPEKLTNAVSYSGDSGGSASITYSLKQTVRCTDDQAAFHMAISADNKLPSDSNITGAVPANQQYFRLTVLWARYELDNYNCVTEINRSDVVVAQKIEGFYEPANRQFTVYTCGKNSTVDPDIHQIAGSTSSSISSIYIKLACRESDQVTFYWSTDYMGLNSP